MMMMMTMMINIIIIIISLPCDIGPTAMGRVIVTVLTSFFKSVVCLPDRIR